MILKNLRIFFANRRFDMALRAVNDSIRKQSLYLGHLQDEIRALKSEMVRAGVGRKMAENNILDWNTFNIRYLDLEMLLEDRERTYKSIRESLLRSQETALHCLLKKAEFNEALSAA